MLPPPFRAMDPADDLAWLAVADWLEEHDDPRRAELTRLTRLLRHDLYDPERRGREDRLMELLAAGVEPCVATLTNGIGMEFVYIPAGTFLMGSPPEEAGRYECEGPIHEVEITRGFYLGRFPVTQAEYEAVTGKNPSEFSSNGHRKDRVKGMDTRRLPVECVSYKAAASFCMHSSIRAEEAGRERAYRLPTEAEWEYSCRAGTSSQPFHFGNSSIHHQANFGFKVGTTTAAGSYLPNAFGLYDMHGNVWEWCADWFAEDYYQIADKKDPRGPRSGSSRVLRGGSMYLKSEACRAASRYWADRADRNGFGFRVCLPQPS